MDSSRRIKRFLHLPLRKEDVAVGDFLVCCLSNEDIELSKDKKYQVLEVSSSLGGMEGTNYWFTVEVDSGVKRSVHSSFFNLFQELRYAKDIKTDDVLECIIDSPNHCLKAGELYQVFRPTKDRKGKLVFEIKTNDKNGPIVMTDVGPEFFNLKQDNS